MLFKITPLFLISSAFLPLFTHTLRPHSIKFLSLGIQAFLNCPLSKSLGVMLLPLITFHFPTFFVKCSRPMVYTTIIISISFLTLVVRLSSIQLLSHVLLFATPWTAAPGLPVLHQLPELTQTHVHRVGDAIQPSRLLSSPSPPAFNLSQLIRVFSNESVLPIRWLRFGSFSFSISPSNEYSGLISFRIDWLDLLPVQGTLKSLLQHHSSKASILQCSAFFMIQLSHPYMTTRKTIALTSKRHSFCLCWQRNVSAF